MARILLVDDDDDSCALLKMLLERHGFDVASRGTLAGAKSALGEEAFDVLVTDIELPDGSGHTLLAAGRPPSLRFAAVLTGFAGDSDRSASKTLGFDVHLAKPIDADELVELIGRGVAQSPPES